GSIPEPDRSGDGNVDLVIDVEMGVGNEVAAAGDRQVRRVDRAQACWPDESWMIDEVAGGERQVANIHRTRVGCINRQLAGRRIVEGADCRGAILGLDKVGPRRILVNGGAVVKIAGKGEADAANVGVAIEGPEKASAAHSRGS